MRAKLVTNPADYNCSGHHSYIGKKREPWITVDWVLGQFSRHRGYARRRYGEFRIRLAEWGLHYDIAGKDLILHYFRYRKEAYR